MMASPNVRGIQLLTRAKLKEKKTNIVELKC